WSVGNVRIRTAAADTGGRSNAIRMTVEGLAGFRHTRPRVLLLLTISVVFIGVLDVAIVVLAFEVFGSEDIGTAWLNAAIGFGAAVGSVLAVILIGRTRLAPSMRGGLLLAAVPVALIPLVNAQAAALVALALAGAGMTLVSVSGRIMLQRVIPLGGLSRAFGVLEGSSMAAEALGAAAAGALIASLGVGWTLVAAGVIIVALLAMNQRPLVDADIGVVVPVEHLHLLRSTPMFTALGPAELERL